MARLGKKINNPNSYGWIFVGAKGLLILYTIWLWITGILVIFRTRNTASTITDPVTLWWETLAGFGFAAIILIAHMIFTRGTKYGEKMKGAYVYELFMIKCTLMYALLFVLFAIFRWDYCDDVDCKMLTHQTGVIGVPEKDIHDRLLTYKILNALLVALSTFLLLAWFDISYYGFIFSTWVRRKEKEKSTPTSQNKFNTTLLD